jgi:predicted transcriptional regulator
MKDLVNLRLNDGDLEKLREIGKREDRTVSYLIRKAISEYLKKV